MSRPVTHTAALLILKSYKLQLEHTNHGPLVSSSETKQDMYYYVLFLKNKL